MGSVIACAALGLRAKSLAEGFLVPGLRSDAPPAVVIALDRQEKATENGVDVDHSAVQYVRNQLGLQVCAIARLSDLLHYLSTSRSGGLADHHTRVLAYRQRYGVE